MCITAKRFVGSRGGFTLIELLVVIAVIVILLSLLFSSLNEAKQKAQTVRCLNNLRQLGIAWQLYAVDHQDRITRNNQGGQQEFPERTWVRGWLDNEVPLADNTNRQFLATSHLWTYAPQMDIWRCPLDKSVTLAGDPAGAMPRTRSVSMNCWLNTDERWNDGAGGERFLSPRKLTDLRAPSPATTFVFIDEREDSINDGFYVVSMNQQGGDSYIVDYPGSYHRGGALLSFADGHMERKRWLDPRTTPPLLKGQNLQLNVPSPNNPDVLWLQQHTTGLIDPTAAAKP